MSQVSDDRMGVARRSLLALLVLAIGINLGTFASTEPEDSDRYRAINRYETPDVLEIGLQVSPHFVEFYAPALALAELAPGAHIIQPAGDVAPFDEEFRVRVLGYGQAAAVSVADYDPAVVLEFVDWERFVVTEGPGGERGPPFAIAMRDEPVEEVVALGGDDLLVLLDRRLIPADLDLEGQR